MKIIGLLVTILAFVLGCGAPVEFPNIAGGTADGSGGMMLAASTVGAGGTGGTNEGGSGTGGANEGGMGGSSVVPGKCVALDSDACAPGENLLAECAKHFGAGYLVASCDEGVKCMGGYPIDWTPTGTCAPIVMCCQKGTAGL